MRYPEEELISLLNNAGADFTCSLPCEKIKILLELLPKNFFHVPLTREEEGVGICAGAALSGKRPAMFVQSSGIGNMINALLSLTKFYELPLAIFISRRGIYKEKIKAQIPMGRKLPGILKGAGIEYSIINTHDDFRVISKKLKGVYSKNKMHAFLMSPKIWEKSGCSLNNKRQRVIDDGKHVPCIVYPEASLREVGTTRFRGSLRHASAPKLMRYDILKIVTPYLRGKVVICNLGFPAKELYSIRHQPSNFYMLGSMGMATPIGLGIALSSNKQVVVIDGDGSLLMNPGTLATAAYFSPENLTILAIDNSSYGSTGDQPTLTGSCVDLEIVAKGFGIKNTFKVSTRDEIVKSVKALVTGVKFIHALAIPGNKDVPNIPIDHIENKKEVYKFISRQD